MKICFQINITKHKFTFSVFSIFALYLVKFKLLKHMSKIDTIFVFLNTFKL